MPNSCKPIPLPRTGRLRNLSARTISGPDVLARRSRFAALHLRADRARFGFDGPAARLRLHHLAAIVGALVAILAIAGAPL